MIEPEPKESQRVLAKEDEIKLWNETIKLNLTFGNTGIFEAMIGNSNSGKAVFGGIASGIFLTI